MSGNTYLKPLSRLNIHFLKSQVNYILFRMPGRRIFMTRWPNGAFFVRRCANYHGLDETYYRMAVNKHKDNTGFINALQDIIREVSV